ncbi:ABC transporter ATP-binding protein [Aureibacillus halotolerans]|uniref:NitT/TauT family transport system ATP-binding protein n=1 Tax=Aureibacillus halotolerans TaxID=1508390 RepID=A0A4R6U4R5_9BACI|nr:ABC transporter ATP-binding protein [Aureibacillus halotolerans]TDQ40492.1 NitT/TauT family transport system ATP-binding protein [Aureibacillus halotolerans]
MFLQLSHINQHFHIDQQTKFTALSDINLSIDEGEFISLLGPSGCGKSTLLSIIAGLLPASDGTILLDGQSISKPGPDRGVVFQQPALFPWMTVLDNVRFPLRKKHSKTEQTVIADKFLKMVHLSKFKERYPHELSGGMQQRVAIARTLAMDPKLLLMDEPFGALDEQTRMHLHDQLEGIWSETKKTIVFVTHSVSEAIQLSDRVVVMGTQPGRILTEFPVDLPRPRRNKQDLVPLEERVLALLSEEIRKVKEEEYQV